MARFFVKNRRKQAEMEDSNSSIQLIGLALCLTILTITVAEKFREGGWLTLVLTSLLIGLCYMIRRHYTTVRTQLMQLDMIMSRMPPAKTDRLRAGGQREHDRHPARQQLQRSRRPHAVLRRPFLSGPVQEFRLRLGGRDRSGRVQGRGRAGQSAESHGGVPDQVRRLARTLGFPAEYRMAVGTDVVEAGTQLCERVSREFPRSTVFSGQLSFRLEKFYHRILHNEVAFAIQRRLQWRGITNVILPIRIGLR